MPSCKTPYSLASERGSISRVSAPSARIVPRAQSLIDRGVIDRVEAGVGAVDGVKERELMCSSEDPV
jgi:hypothetical protein